MTNRRSSKLKFPFRILLFKSNAVQNVNRLLSFFLKSEPLILRPMRISWIATLSKVKFVEWDPTNFAPPRWNHNNFLLSQLLTA